MARLEDLKPGCTVRGIRLGEPINVIDVRSHGPGVVELTFRTQAGKVESEASAPDGPPADTKAVELAAMAAVMAAERALGYEPRDASAAKVGYDVESLVLGTGKLRFIEIKGRAAGATTVTIIKNEILTALNKPEGFVLALVVADGDTADVRRSRDSRILA